MPGRVPDCHCDRPGHLRADRLGVVGNSDRPGWSAGALVGMLVGTFAADDRRHDHQKGGRPSGRRRARRRVAARNVARTRARPRARTRAWTRRPSHRGRMATGGGATRGATGPRIVPGMHPHELAVTTGATACRRSALPLLTAVQQSCSPRCSTGCGGRTVGQPRRRCGEACARPALSGARASGRDAAAGPGAGAVAQRRAPDTVRDGPGTSPGRSSARSTEAGRAPMSGVGGAVTRPGCSSEGGGGGDLGGDAGWRRGRGGVLLAALRGL